MTREHIGTRGFGGWPAVLAVNALIFASAGRDLGLVAFAPPGGPRPVGGLPMPTARDVVLTFLVLLAWSHLSIALHELGHAAVARGVGGRVKSVEVGRGRVVGRLHAGGVLVTLAAVPAGGRTMHAGVIRPRRRLMVAAAGPGMDGLLAALAFAVLVASVTAAHHRGPVALSAGGTAPALAEAVLIVTLHQVSLLIGNLVPRALPGGRRTDGASIVAICRGERVAAIPVTWGAAWDEATRRSDAGDPSLALTVLEQAPRSASGPAELRGWHASVAFHLARAGRFDEAIAHLDKTFDAELAPLQVAALSDARADAVVSRAVLQGQDLDLAWLRECRAGLQRATTPGLRHRAALVHLLLDEPDLAVVAAIEASRAASLTPVDRAVVQATVTMALAAVGDHAQARHWYDDIPLWCPWRAAAEQWLAHGGRPVRAGEPTPEAALPVARA